MKKSSFRTILLMLFVVTIILFGNLPGSNCNDVCTDPEAPCCCPKKDGYYLGSYTCACAGGELQYQECHYEPLP